MPDRAVAVSLVPFCVVVASALALPPERAAAQEGATPADAGAATEDPPPESAEDLATAESLEDMEARANFEAGRVAFAAARYADALGYFEHAHELSGRHQLLYNVGLCHDRLGHDADALRSFEQYLAAAPDAHNRAEVEQRIETARVRIERAAASATLPAPTPTGPDSAPWALFGAGAAVAVAGAVLVTVGRLDIASVESIPDGTRAWGEVAADVDRADALTIGGAVALGVGAALATSGIAWAASGSGGVASEAPAATVRVGLGSLLLTGTF